MSLNYLDAGDLVDRYLLDNCFMIFIEVEKLKLIN